MEYIIDAQGKKLGRVAAEAANALQGKNTPDYQKHVLAGVTVKINNAGALDIGPRQMEREYKRYSGYPGGLTLEKGKKLMERKGIKSILERAISGMLPKNTHRPRLIQKLVITE
jgi:large subunit ribosomal protein L13